MKLIRHFTGRNVIIEQSFGGPKITKGKPFLSLWIYSYLSHHQME
jgi:hypothetical protein